MSLLNNNILYMTLKHNIYKYLSKRQQIKYFTEIINNDEYKNIVLFDTAYYDSLLKQRPHHLAEQFGKKFDLVLYPTLQDNDFKFIGKNLLTCPIILLEKLINKNVWLCIESHSCNFSVNEYIYLKKLGVHLVYEYLDDFCNEIFSARKNAYNIYKNLEKIDPELIVTTASNLYAEMKKRFPNKKIILAKNGANINDFQNIDKTIIPKDIKKIVDEKKPIIGYYGYIAPWLNYDLIDKLALKYKEYNFVYIGILSDGIELNKFDNLYYLGKKEYSKLPLYSQYFDCCIIPFKYGAVALGTSPLKLYEHMAQQKPVVCTRDLIECRGYDGVFVCEDDQEFINTIPKAIELSKNEEIKQKLLEQAETNSWDNISNLILNEINF